MGIKRTMERAKSKDKTLDDLLREYISEKRARNMSPKTIKGYEESYERFSRFLIEHDMTLIAKFVTSDYVKKFTEHLLYDKDDKVKPSSVNHYLRDIRAFLYWCQNLSEVESFKVNMVVEPQTIRDPLSIKEQQKLLAKPSRSDSFVKWRTWAMTNWMIATGNRVGTMANIMMKDVAFDSMEIIIRVSKTNKVEVLPMSPALAAVLREYIREWRRDAVPTDYLFCNIAGEQATVHSLQQSYRKYVHSKDLTNTSLHSGRCTFAKGWIMNQGDVFRLQKMLLHSSITTTKKYVDLYGADLKKDFEQFNPLDSLKRDNHRTHAVKRCAR